MDVTQKILENDYQMTNFNDNMREGDIAAKTPVRSKTEREAIEKLEHDAKEMSLSANNLHPQTKQFWGGGQGQVSIGQAALADVKASKGEHIGMEALAKAGKAGHLAMPMRLLSEDGRTIVRKG